MLQAAWEAGSAEAVTSLADTPTDLLRLFAALTETDVSLSDPIKFPKMSRVQRRAVLAVLEGSSSLPEDLYMGGKSFHNNVEGAHGNVAAACREIVRFTTTRPTLETLALLHLDARGGERVQEQDQADITIGFGPEHTVDVGNVERVLAELL